MDIHPSARKHGVAGTEIRHAFDHRIVQYDISDDHGPSRVLVIGAGRAANLLELVLIECDDGTLLTIHAMPLRRRYRHLLPTSLELDPQ